MNLSRTISAVVVLLACGLLVGPGTHGLVFELLRSTVPVAFPEYPVRTYWLTAFWLVGIAFGVLRFRKNRPFAIRGVGMFLFLLTSIHAVLSVVWTLLGRLWRMPEMTQYESIVDIAYAVIFLPSYLLNLPVPILEVTLPSLLWAALVFVFFFRRRVVRL